MKQIIRNIIRCNHCGDEIESLHTHHYVECACGAVGVDGGTQYLRRSFTHSPDDYTELAQFAPQQDDAAKA